MTHQARQLELSDSDPLRRRPHRRAGRGVPGGRHRAAAAGHRSRARRAADDREERARRLRPRVLARRLLATCTAEPGRRNVDGRLAAYRAGGHDGVIAFGGGSALDAGKAIAFMSGQTRPIWDFEDVGDWWTRADPEGIAPIVAVPTTAGTGSEVGRAARHHRRGDAHEEDHLPPADAAGDR